MARDDTGLIVEELNSKFDAVIELVMQTRRDIKKLATAQELDIVKQDVKVIKAAVTDLSLVVADHEARLTS